MRFVFAKNIANFLFRQKICYFWFLYRIILTQITIFRKFFFLHPYTHSSGISYQIRNFISKLEISYQVSQKNFSSWPGYLW